MEPVRRATELARAGVFAAFVAAATMVVSVFVAPTGGFFNIGEVMVYTAAILGGPFVGAFAGGIGSMIADVSLGYALFAPGTLVIKGVEGFIVGYLVRHMPDTLSRARWRALATGLGIGVALLVAAVGLAGVGFATAIPQYLWLVVAGLTVVLFAYAGIIVDPKVGWIALSVLAGGAEMVMGYFLYEWGPLQIGLQASLAEVPINLGQMLVGLVVALPLTRAVLRIAPGVIPPPRRPLPASA